MYYFVQQTRKQTNVAKMVTKWFDWDGEMKVCVFCFCFVCFLLVFVLFFLFVCCCCFYLLPIKTTFLLGTQPHWY